MKRNLSQILLLLMSLRVVIITTFVATAFLINFFSPETLPLLWSLYLLTGITYLFTLCYGLVYRFWQNSTVFVYVQLIGDLLLETGLVYLTGGSFSSFTFLYFLSIITAGIIFYRKGALFIASLAAIFYGLLVDLMYYQVLPLYLLVYQGYETVTLTRIYYSLFANFFGFYAVALLSGYIASRLREAGAALERKKSDLADLQAFNRNILHSMSGALLTTDLTGTITYVNRATEHITGFAAQDLIGRSLPDFFAVKGDFPEGLEQSLSIGQNLRFDGKAGTADGRIISVGCTLSCLTNEKGQLLGFLCIFRDMTEIHQLERQVRLSDRMAAVGEMAAGIAHEIRNPLAAMHGSVQMLQEASQFDGEGKELLGIILKESARLNTILQHFLAYARPDEFEPQEVDLCELLSETVLLLQKSHQMGPQHRIRKDFQPKQVHSYVDPHQMRQIFWNIANNSLEAMPDGGVLTVSVRRRADGDVLLSFQDEGVGMSEEQIEKIFHPFRSKNRQGSGLGLPIVHRIIQAHDGSLAIRSEPGQGTEFQILLPALAKRSEHRRKDRGRRSACG